MQEHLVSVVNGLVSCVNDEHTTHKHTHAHTDMLWMRHMRGAMRESCCMVGERMWDGASVVDTLKLMIDTGASTHMCNDRRAFIQGSVVACDVDVMGVGGTVTHITEKGSISLVVGDRDLVLTDVLLHGGAQLGAGLVHEPQVLVGVRKFAENTGLGLSFPADGKSMIVMNERGVAIAIAETNDAQLYVVQRQDLATRQIEKERVSVAFSDTKQVDLDDKTNHKVGLIRETSIEKVFSMGAKGVLDAQSPSLSQGKEKFAVLAFPGAAGERVRNRPCEAPLRGLPAGPLFSIELGQRFWKRRARSGRSNAKA
jgi:hypothetical protein